MLIFGLSSCSFRQGRLALRANFWYISLCSVQAGEDLALRAILLSSCLAGKNWLSSVHAGS